jgi:hypothetical protein
MCISSFESGRINPPWSLRPVHVLNKEGGDLAQLRSRRRCPDECPLWALKPPGTDYVLGRRALDILLRPDRGACGPASICHDNQFTLEPLI